MGFANLILYFTAIVWIWELSNAKGVTPLINRVSGETHPAEPTWGCVQKLKAGKTWKTLNTKGFPKSLAIKYSRCTWKISAPGKSHIRLAFRVIDLFAEDVEHCSSNYLDIIDEVLGKSQGRMCGRKTSGDIVSRGNKLRVDLQLDLSDTQQRGFSLSYMATKAKSGFYSKKSFNEKPLPPQKKAKLKKDKDEEEKTTSSKKKSGSKPKNSASVVISSDGQLVSSNAQNHPSKRQVDNDNQFKRLNTGEDGSGGLSTLAIIGIVIGGCVGLLIIFLILRKLFLNNRNKNKKNDDKENDDGSAANSGLPKMNMAHDKVANSKRNILAPTVIVAKHQEANEHPIPRDRSPSMSQTSSAESSGPDNPPPNNNKQRTVSWREKKSPQRSRSNVKQQNNGFTNKGYVKSPDMDEHPPPYRDVRRQPSGRKNPSKTKKVPYRYNSKKNQDWDQKKALEALNNEQFCEYGTVYINPHRSPDSKKLSSNRHSKDPAPPVREMVNLKSRQSTSHNRNRNHSHTDESDNSDVFLPKHANRHSVLHQRERELPGQSYRRKDDRLKGGRSKTWHTNEKSNLNKLDNKVPARRRSTIGEPFDKHIKRGENGAPEKRRSEKALGYIGENDYNIKTSVKQSRSRFIEAPPSPSLPRHIVPSSRR